MKQIGLSLAIIITTLLALLGMLDAIGCTGSYRATMMPPQAHTLSWIHNTLPITKPFNKD